MVPWPPDLLKSIWREQKAGRIVLKNLLYDKKKSGQLGMDEKETMIHDMISAAFPWILMGLFVAICCSFMSKQEK